MVYYFKSGTYEGKTVEQVALTDYNHLNWLYEKRKFEDKKNFLTKNLEDIIGRLNNFVPAVTCKHLGCKDIADYLTIIIDFGRIPRGDHDREGVTGFSISANSYVWCDKHKLSYSEKAVPYEIKYGAITDLIKKYGVFEAHGKLQKWVREDIQETLNQCAGFSGRKTAENCSNFIYSLEQKGEGFKKLSDILPDVMGDLKKMDENKKKNDDNENQLPLF